MPCPAPVVVLRFPFRLRLPIPILLLLSLLLMPSRGWAQGAADAEPAATGVERLKVDLLGVFAHPDDETGIAATIARLALGSHRRVAHVYCTRGEGGGNMVGTQSGPALGLLREIRLQ